MRLPTTLLTPFQGQFPDALNDVCLHVLCLIAAS